LNPGSTVKVGGMATTTSDPVVPNHHAHHPGFAGLAGLTAGLTMLRGDRRAGLALQLTGLSAGDVLVDVGCGPGRAARLAARHGATVIGIDPADVMLRMARFLTPSRRRISWRAGTAEALPVADGVATVVWSIATVHHWQDIAAGLAEARRVLAPGGRFLAIERERVPGATGLASHGWTPEQAAAFADAARAAGFVDVVDAAHTSQQGAALSVLALVPSATA
jgi:ubiquinone/menaquinone biosynthesis C-methylase UbiE